MSAEALLERLAGVKGRGPGRWIACCPAHEDAKPSLTITEDHDRVLVHCHAGCKAEEILGAVGLTFDALFDKPLERSAHHLRELGNPSYVYDYRSAAGVTVFQIARYERAGGKELRPWRQEGGRLVCRAAPPPRVLYRLPELLADRERPVLVVEGEKCADVAAQILGAAVAVTTWAGGTGQIAQTDFSLLIGRAVALWPDNDEPGRRAMAHIAAKLGNGVTKVFTVDVGDRPAGWDVADAVAEGMGEPELQAFITRRLPAEEIGTRLSLPLHRVIEVDKLWVDGMPAGDLTGWVDVDELYTVVPGQLTVITGWPGAGKSEWLDALLVNLASGRAKWCFVIHSPENFPIEVHLAKLLEKWLGKPFGPGPSERIAREALHPTLETLGKYFAFVDSPRGGLAVQDIIAKAAAHFQQAGRHGLVIDPWSELEHSRPQGMSETEYISLTLSTLRNWARSTGAHVFLVAHPQKIQRTQDGQLPIPRPDMISGSQHWWNKSDNCITVWRDQLPSAALPFEVTIYVTKIRFKHVGHVGEATLRYDKVTGQYFERSHVATQGIDF